MAKRILVAVCVVVATMSLLVLLTPLLRDRIWAEYLIRRNPVIPKSELRGESNTNQKTLSDGSTYFVNNGRQFYVKGVTAQVIFPDGRKETRYLGTVTLLPQGQIVDYQKRQIAISQGDDQQIITIPDAASIQKQTLSTGTKPGDITFSPVSPATLADIHVGDTVQLIEGETVHLLIIQKAQK